MSTSSPSAYRRDIHPKQFLFVIFVGCVASGLLSWLEAAGWISVVVACVIMLVLAMIRWKIAEENRRDYQSLEAFAEDIYLLGYLLTLAAFLGMAARWVSSGAEVQSVAPPVSGLVEQSRAGRTARGESVQDRNIFKIAGMKLGTTVLGLALMMVFRQTARRWAEQKEGEETERFVEQQKLFSEAVGRLNEGADQLTSKLDQIVHWFDPKLLEPLSEWSNRAAGAFSTATSNLEAVPGAVRKSLQQLQAICDDFAKVRTAAGELAGILTAGPAQAANVLATELGSASKSADGLGAAMAAIVSASEGARGGIDALGSRATKGGIEMGELGESLHRTALELAKVERALKKLAEVDTKDVNSPINRLADVVVAASEKAAVSSDRMEVLKGELQEVATASRELANRLTANVGEPLTAHGDKLQRLHEQLGAATGHLGRVAKGMEEANAQHQGRDGFETKLLAELSALHKAMEDTNEQLGLLVEKIQRGMAGETKPPGGFWGLFRGGG